MCALGAGTTTTVEYTEVCDEDDGLLELEVTDPKETEDTELLWLATGATTLPAGAETGGTTACDCEDTRAEEETDEGAAGGTAAI